MLENGMPLSRATMINIHKKNSVDVLFWANIEPNKRGSFEDFMLRLSQEAMNQGLKIKFVFGNKVSGYYKDKNIDYISTNISNLNSVPFLRSVLKKEQPRTIHFHFMGLASPMIWCSKFLGVKHIIYTDHASSTCQLAPKNMLINYLKKQRKAFYLKKIDAIIAVSDFVAQRLYKYNRITPGKVKRIYNGIDMQRFAPLPGDQLKIDLKRNLFQAGASDKVITYAGQFIEEKGVKPYIQAVERLLARHNDLCFVFVGQGPLYDFAIQTIPDHVRSRTKFLGVRDDMENIFRASDIVVTPSIWEEAFGLVAAEASACGVPVVASNIGGLPEVVLDRKTGILTPPGDIPALVKALERLIADHDMRKQMGIQGRRHAVKNFDIQQIVPETLNLYKKLG